MLVRRDNLCYAWLGVKQNPPELDLSLRLDERPPKHLLRPPPLPQNLPRRRPNPILAIPMQIPNLVPILTLLPPLHVIPPIPHRLLKQQIHPTLSQHGSLLLICQLIHIESFEINGRVL